MAVMALILTSLNACSQNEGLTVYNKSVDVHLEGWAPTDTLFYNITVTEPASIKYPIVTQRDYRMNMSVRFSTSLKLTHLPFLLTLQQTDTIGGYEHPIRNIFRQELSLEVRDTTGIPLGESWGSLYSVETTSPSPTIRFDTAGTYRLMIIPTIGNLKSLPGVASIGIQLEK